MDWRVLRQATLTPGGSKGEENHLRLERTERLLEVPTERSEQRERGEEETRSDLGPRKEGVGKTNCVFNLGSKSRERNEGAGELDSFSTTEGLKRSGLPNVDII